MTIAGSRASGHRVLRRDVDRVVEAWGPDRAVCIAEALRALVETFADVPDEVATRVLPIGAGASESPDALVGLLEEVIYVVDVFGMVPVRFHLGIADDGAVGGDMEVVPLQRVKLNGPVPVEVSHRDTSMHRRGGGWRCQAVVGV